MTSKADLLEALDYTAWTPSAETIHSYLHEYHPERGQPQDTCALCFRPHPVHCTAQPGRFGWPHEWRWHLGEPFPDTGTAVDR